MEDLFDFKDGSIASTDADGGEYLLYTADESIHSHSEYTNENEAIILTYNAGGSLGKFIMLMEIQNIVLVTSISY